MTFSRKAKQLPLKLKNELVGGHPSKQQLVPLHVPKVVNQINSARIL
jgi:hypothetical protein